MRPAIRLLECGDELIELFTRYGFTNIRVFGSVARGNDFDDSDLDLLVTTPRHIGWDYYTVLEEAERIFGRHVDVMGDTNFGNAADEARRTALPIREVMERERAWLAAEAAEAAAAAHA